MNVFWAVQIACLSAIVNEKSDKTCRQYVLNFLKATRALKNAQLKAINVAALVKAPRLTSDIFDPLEDCDDMLTDITIALKH